MRPESQRKFTWRKIPKKQPDEPQCYILYYKERKPVAVVQSIGDQWYWFTKDKDTQEEPTTLQAAKDAAKLHIVGPPKPLPQMSEKQRKAALLKALRPVKRLVRANHLP